MAMKTPSRPKSLSPLTEIVEGQSSGSGDHVTGLSANGMEESDDVDGWVGDEGCVWVWVFA